jgi:hypothetical protein
VHFHAGAAMDLLVVTLLLPLLSGGSNNQLPSEEVMAGSGW